MPPSSSDPDLPSTEVPSDAYTTHYYLHSCIGADAWRESGGNELDYAYAGYVKRAELRRGEVVIDLGTGRGDLLAAAIQAGAARAYGIEYSADAVALARQTLRAHQIEDRAEVIHGDTRSVPLPDQTADLIFLLEVAEHLTPSELQMTLSEARRLLKPDGRMLIHTMPNRLIYTATYRVMRLIAGGRWPADPRNDLEHLMHVNELTVRELRRTIEGAGLRADVSLGEWIYTDFVPSRIGRRVYRLLAKVPPLAGFVIADIWAVGRR